MATKFSNQIATALRLIQDSGTTATLNKVTSGSIDPITGVSTEVITPHSNLPVVQLPSSLPESMLPEALRGRRNKQLLMAASGMTVEPAANDMVTIGATDWLVYSVATLAPDGVPILHTLMIYQ